MNLTRARENIERQHSEWDGVEERDLEGNEKEIRPTADRDDYGRKLCSREN